MNGTFQDIYNIGCTFEPGQITVIGSRPAMGKTTFALNLMLDFLELGKSCVYISNSEPKEILEKKLLSCVSEIELQKLITKKLDSHEYQRFVEASSTLSKYDLKIRSDPYHKHENVNIIFIDYFQLLQDPRYQNRYEELEQIMLDINMQAKEKKQHIVILSQLNSKSDERPGHKPCITDLRHCNLDEIADYIFFPLRREYYDPLDKPGKLDLIVDKNRNGSPCILDYFFSKETFQIGKLTNFFNREEL